jgi:hypothetical protein
VLEVADNMTFEVFIVTHSYPASTWTTLWHDVYPRSTNNPYNGNDDPVSEIMRGGQLVGKTIGAPLVSSAHGPMSPFSGRKIHYPVYVGGGIHPGPRLVGK